MENLRSILEKRFNHKFSEVNNFSRNPLCIIMGIETPMPPVRMNAAAPDGASPQRTRDADL